ncbi:hypothetical protein E2C01_025459 [Portunus trituberculatus]|uniref:Uncharacterized protein n=1 Tax=Portunus trituberculatus TaxID=210409 RepID=A0A5B7EHZ9_PORTR|nr:hypothetical protein [Portunus trituberculatus]
MVVVVTVGVVVGERLQFFTVGGSDRLLGQRHKHEAPTPPPSAAPPSSPPTPSIFIPSAHPGLTHHFPAAAHARGKI